MICGRCRVGDLHVGDVIEFVSLSDKKNYGRVLGVERLSETTSTINFISIKDPEDTIGPIKSMNLEADAVVWVTSILMPTEQDAIRAKEALESIR